MARYEIPPEVGQYLDELIASGRKPNTVNAYKYAIGVCLWTLERDGRPTGAEDIRPEDIRHLWDNLGIKETVRQSYLRIFAGFLIHETGRDVVKQADILHNREIRERVFITFDDYSAMMAAADPTERMILVLGGMMGLRREEMTRIRDEDICDGMMTIHGKGHGQDGLVVKARIPEPVMAEIMAFREYKAGFRKNSGDGFLLQTPNRARTLTRVPPQRVSHMVAALGKRVGIHATTHSLRRLYATVLYYKVEADINTIKNLMRHADVSTTLKCYIRASDESERKAIGRLADVMSSAFA